MKNNIKLRSQPIRLFLSALLTGPAYLLFVPGYVAAPPVTSAQVESLVEQLEDAHKRADWQKVHDRLEYLINLGPERIPTIMQKMKHPQTGRNLKTALVQAIYRTGGDEATDALLDISLNDPEPEIARMAGISINNRIIHKPIPEEQLNVLISRIESKADGIAAGQWAYVLARAEHLDTRKLARPLVNRFVKELGETNRKPLPPVRDIYLSPKAWYLNTFLRPFIHIDPSAAHPLLNDAIAAATDDDTKKWLFIACGFAGDEAVAEELRKLVENKTEDVSLRALALSAYAIALKADSEPLLRAYENDATPGPNTREPPPLRIVAHDELAELHKNSSTLRIRIPQN